MASNYQVVAASADGGGTITFPIGTIFPCNADPEYDDKGKVKREREFYFLEGFFQEGGATDDLIAKNNFDKFFELFDFTNQAGRCTITIKFGGAIFRSIPVHARGPRLRNCRLLPQGGSVATHAHFSIEIEEMRDPDTAEIDEASSLKREKTEIDYNERRQETVYTVMAEGKDAEKLVMKFKPSSAAGPVEQTRNQKVDELTWIAAWKIETPHRVGQYLRWEREIEVVEGGVPLEEIPVFGIPQIGGGVVAGQKVGPVIRRGLQRAAVVTDTSRFTTLGQWRSNLPTVPFLYPVDRRDPLRSSRRKPDTLVDPIKDWWTRTIKDVYIMEPEKLGTPVITAPAKSPATAPADPAKWNKINLV